jgi:AraC-like DNA-binding protein
VTEVSVPDDSASDVSGGPKRSRATVAAGFVRGMLSGIATLPGAPGREALLAAAGIAPEVLAGELRVPLERYAALYNTVVAALDDEGFGLFSAPLRAGAFEFLCRSTISAPDLATALERASRFLRVVLPDLAFAPRRDAAGASLLIEATALLPERAAADPRRVFAYEWLLRLIHGLSSWLVGRGIVLDRVEFPYPRPQHAADYALIYTADSRFDAPRLAAHFAPNLLDLPIRRDEAALAVFLDGAPGKIATLYRRDRDMVLRVRNLLRAALPDLPDLAQVAARLHLSERTLHRRLEEEGSGFRAIKDALRRDLALARLAKSRAGVAEIAAGLGFTDPSAFYRAFVGWTGKSPQQYRKELAGSV